MGTKNPTPLAGYTTPEEMQALIEQQFRVITEQAKEIGTLRAILTHVGEIAAEHEQVEK